jgi:hypothetical protein
MVESSVEKRGRRRRVRVRGARGGTMAEREGLCDATKGINEDKGSIYRKKMMHPTVG